jgi:hypothetical protein
MVARGKINNCLDAGNLIANGAAQPGHPVLPSRLVSYADGSDTYCAAGRNGARQVVALGDDDQLFGIEDLPGADT